MRDKLAKLRRMEWYIIQYYNYRIEDIQKWLDRANQLNVKDDNVQFLIVSLAVWVDFHTHLPESYTGYEIMEI
jgi:hypothetical protein